MPKAIAIDSRRMRHSLRDTSLMKGTTGIGKGQVPAVAQVWRQLESR
jgi:hypothetical protein